MATKVTASPAPPTQVSSINNANKRKRAVGDDAGRNINNLAVSSNTDSENFQDLLQEITDAGSLVHDDSQRTAQAALASQSMSTSNYPEPHHFDANTSLPSFDQPTPTTPVMGTASQQMYDARQGQGQQGNKPNVGTPEWHQVRKDNHKEGKPHPTLLTVAAVQKKTFY